MFVAVSETPDDDLETGSRSPSPEAPFEDAHEELLEDDFAEEDPHEEDTSVVAGGYREGWGPVAAVVLWRRVLGILGNVNTIKNPAIHANVLKCLTSIWNMLAKVTFTLSFNLKTHLRFYKCYYAAAKTYFIVTFIFSFILKHVQKKSRKMKINQWSK